MHDELKRLAEKATPGPWFAGPLDGDEDQQSISVGLYELRPNKTRHYEDTLLEVWDNPNLSGEPETAVANAALIVALVNGLPTILAALAAYQATKP